MLKFINKTSLVAFATAVGLSGVAQAAIDEIIVTAAKREQSLQEIPISVSVTSAETIERAHIIDLLDLQSVVPSLRITQLQTSATTNFIIRGFGNGANNPGIEPSVGVYIDGVYRSRSGAALADLPTVERVEVLRGPQSTLFGKNASAGVISVTTALPEDEFGGKAEVTIGNYDIKILKATVTGPVSDTTAYRLTVSSNNNDGYYTNTTNGDKLNDRDRWAIRGQLLSNLSDNITLRVIADYNKIDEICCGVSMIQNGPLTNIANAIAVANGNQAVSAANPSARRIPLNFNPENVLKSKGLSAQFDVDLDGMAFTSITSLREQTVYSNTDADFNAASLIAENFIDDEFETLTQEFRLTSDNDSDLQWMVGAYYFQEDVKHNRNVLYGSDIESYVNTLVQGATGCLTAASTCTDLTGLANTLTLLGAGLTLASGAPANAATIAGVPALQTAATALRGGWLQSGQGLLGEDFTMDNEAISIFGQVDYNINDRLVATLGLNYTEDKKVIVSNVVIDDPFSALPFAGNPATAGLTRLQFFRPFINYGGANTEGGTFKSDDLTHALRLAYDWDDTTNVYVSHSTGFKATSVNMSVDARIVRVANPEETTNIEIGVKKSFDRGYFNLALFEQEIDGFQSNLFNGVGFDLTNAGVQVHRGVEIDAVYQATDQLTIFANGTYLDPEFETYNVLPGLTDAVAAATTPEARAAAEAVVAAADLTGQAPAGVHEFSTNIGATYAFSVGEAVDGYFRAEYLYESDVQIVDNVPASIASREVNVFNASLGLANNKGGEITFWVRNLTDDDYFLSAFPTTAATGSFSGYLNAPRTFGITLRHRF